MNILGIDQSLTATGLIVLDEDGALKASRLLLKKPTVPEVKRMIDISTEIMDTIEEFGIKEAAIEGFAFMAKGKVFELGGLGYIIRAVLYQHDIDLITVAPGTLKKFVTGKGNCAKNLILLHVYKKWGVEFHDDNLADAYGLCQYLLSHHGKSGYWTGKKLSNSHRKKLSDSHKKENTQ